MIGETISHYRILEKLGADGMAEVYKAEGTTLGRLVALKFLSVAAGVSRQGTPGDVKSPLQDPQSVERFLSEACAGAVLAHFKSGIDPRPAAFYLACAYAALSDKDEAVRRIGIPISPR
jgi:serine/threonine protein kinase